MGASACPLVSPKEDLPPPGQEGKAAEVEVQPEPAGRAEICTLVSQALFALWGEKVSWERTGSRVGCVRS